MLRIVVGCIDDGINKETKLVDPKVTYILADLLAGCWLNGAFRWPECFGLSHTLADEL